MDSGIWFGHSIKNTGAGVAQASMEDKLKGSADAIHSLNEHIVSAPIRLFSFVEGTKSAQVYRSEYRLRSTFSFFPESNVNPSDHAQAAASCKG